MSDSEEALIERLKQGDEDALVRFIETRRPQLLAFIARSLSDALKRKVEPTDILQEVTVSALHSLDEIELGDRDPFSWLCQLGERRIIDAHRKHIGAQKRSAKKEVGLHGAGGGSDKKGFLDVLVASMTSPSAAFSRGQREFHLLQALESLPQEGRDALKLRRTADQRNCRTTWQKRRRRSCSAKPKLKQAAKHSQPRQRLSKLSGTPVRND